MIRRAEHAAHHTLAEITQYLDAALKLTEELDVPEDLRVIFFDKAVNMLSAHQILFEQIQANAVGMLVPRG